MKNKIYEDKYFYIEKCAEYPNIPGMLTICEKETKWFTSIEAIKRLAYIEKTIKEEIKNFGFELMGIYGEERENGQFRIIIIPYSVDELRKNNISPDLYQPYIKKYLDNYLKDNENCTKIDEAIIKKIRGDVSE